MGAEGERAIDPLDIDAAAIEIERRAEAWMMAGVAVAPMTWHEKGSSPPVVLTDRSAVSDADSVGVLIGDADRTFAHVVLYRYGWVDLDIVNWETEDVEATTGTPIRDVEQFGAFLDVVFDRLNARSVEP